MRRTSCPCTVSLTLFFYAGWGVVSADFLGGGRISEGAEQGRRGCIVRYTPHQQDNRDNLPLSKRVLNGTFARPWWYAQSAHGMEIMFCVFSVVERMAGHGYRISTPVGPGK